MEHKRLISFILAILIFFSSGSTVFAENSLIPKDEQNNEEYSIVEINGMKMRVYDVDDPSTYSRSSVKPLSVGDNTTKTVTIDWDTYDLEFPEKGIEVYLIDASNQKIVGSTIVTESNKKQFIQELDGYDPSNNKWRIAVPDNIKYDIRLRQSSSSGPDFLFKVTQTTMSVYKAEWHDSDSTKRPDLTGRWYSAANIAFQFQLTKNNELYYSTLLPNQRSSKVLMDDVEITITTDDDTYNAGKFTRANLELSKDATSTEHIKGTIKVGSEHLSNGKLAASGNSPAYFFKVFGDHKTLWRYAMWEVLSVKFNSGEGKFSAEGEAGAETDAQEIGYGEKFTGNESGRTVDEPTVVAPTGKKFKGWSETADGAVINKNEYTFTNAETTLYAIYEKDDDQYVNITANTNDDKNSTVATEGNPVEVAKDSKWGDIKAQVASLVTPNDGYAIYNWLIEAGEESYDEVKDETTFNSDTTVIANVKKIIEEGTNPDDPARPGYVRVEFFADDKVNATPQGEPVKGMLKSTKVGSTNASVKYLYYDVLDTKTYAEVPVPEIVPNAGYTVAENKWKPEVPTASTTIAASKHEAQYLAKDPTDPDIIEKDPTDPGEVDPDRVRITFLKGDHGTLTSPKYGAGAEKVIYDVKKAVTFDKITVPAVTAEDKWTHTGWEPKLPEGSVTVESIAEPREFTALYEELGTGGPTDPDSNPVDPTPSVPNDDQDTEEPDKKPEIEIIFGEDRIGTAIEVSKRKFGEADTVIIARHDVFADALVAGPLAYALDAPILLTRPTELMHEVKAEIERLGAKHIIIVGGLASIDENVEKALRAIDEDLERLEGPTRYETSVKVADRLKEANGGRTIAVIATGVTYPDALTVGPFAAVEGMPILLVKPQEIPEMVGEAFDRLGIQEIYIAGGEASVGEELESQMPKLIARFSGQDRYATAVEIAKATRPNAKHIYIASGEVFPDALVAGPAAAKENAPILLSRRNVVPEILKDYIDRLSLDKITIVGGENTITRGSIESLFD